MLKQTKENVELILNELDSLSINFDTNPEISVNLKQILRSSKITLDEYKLLNTIMNFIYAPANARPYIQSIYVYFNNDNKRLKLTYGEMHGVQIRSKKGIGTAVYISVVTL